MKTSTQTKSKCRHCGQVINHYSGRLWHEEGALVFPQYCRAEPGHESQLHEPLTEERK